jgi:hypothetical protein
VCASPSDHSEVKTAAQKVKRSVERCASSRRAPNSTNHYS